ncbi:hypothetical protein [Ornithinimicrobium sp. LYQ103]|uniref:hypothetical protein n=1 Tax=Ornithinimicrobium sp. LYQ103 TaxID=3378796 RepID=UPI003854B471
MDDDEPRPGDVEAALFGLVPDDDERELPEEGLSEDELPEEELLEDEPPDEELPPDSPEDEEDEDGARAELEPDFRESVR